ncbi:hypothetical protein [Nitrososphaera viennensis]|uniref:Uncharacterized protein n=2 Tax=Nitrososphaera viennensis TaxID=1034015 RepID=A0A060HUZ5_9ARCH|nr:hypothetical protein [Nitrososphaera viennensis]AIC16877.1 hypothetical protein NVIE_026060 [Nitrososphaera viennensis EN76]UVS68780.1 hypothetical protein NWT39_12845 [Nitrososphaera viennensis]
MDGGIERKLQGRTLQVYLYLLKKGEPGGIREIQRDLGLSSPSVADYQVEKLVGMGLAAKDSHGRVCITRKVKVRALESYVNFGRFSVPRLAFYASVFSAVAVLYVLFNLSSWSIYGVAVPLAAAGVLWLEAWRMWRFSLLERADKAENSSRNAARGILPLFAPGAIALFVFAIGGAFLFQYVQEPPSVQMQSYIPEASSSITSQQQTIEESLTLSREKVASAGESAFAAPGLASSVLPPAGATVIGFLGYLLVKYRCEGRVLVPEQARAHVSGTQDYPERSR